MRGWWVTWGVAARILSNKIYWIYEDFRHRKRWSNHEYKFLLQNILLILSIRTQSRWISLLNIIHVYYYLYQYSLEMAFSSIGLSSQSQILPSQLGGPRLGGTPSLPKKFATFLPARPMPQALCPNNQQVAALHQPQDRGAWTLPRVPRTAESCKKSPPQGLAFQSWVDNKDFWILSREF